MVALVIGASEVGRFNGNACPFFVGTSFVRSLVVRVGFDNRFEDYLVVSVALEPDFHGIEPAQVVCAFCNAGADNDVPSKFFCLVLYVENVFPEDGTVGFLDSVCRFRVEVVLDGCAVVRLDVPIELVFQRCRERVELGAAFEVQDFDAVDGCHERIAQALPDVDVLELGGLLVAPREQPRSHRVRCAFDADVECRAVERRVPTVNFKRDEVAVSVVEADVASVLGGLLEVEVCRVQTHHEDGRETERAHPVRNEFGRHEADGVFGNDFVRILDEAKVNRVLRSDVGGGLTDGVQVFGIPGAYGQVATRGSADDELSKRVGLDNFVCTLDGDPCVIGAVRQIDETLDRACRYEGGAVKRVFVVQVVERVLQGDGRFALGKVDDVGTVLMVTDADPAVGVRGAFVSVFDGTCFCGVRHVP